ncbi:uncharacterized protein LY89DRAFT_744404 [Mollisia scopiformis]|uniref:Uncharacterized protein n=1 Tax=Mollisia scopiformis TaxID=149040 RepID=A0A194XU69_MOLSC|nr:uncharacterized protein LY89DRAFT_744404 [Mollisia scopiformis]KUJ23865.1 hypothetical protein LY89DRAFT_744404 [Mollisia scopiformis]
MKFTTSLLTLAGLASLAIASAIPGTAELPSCGYKNYPTGIMTFKGTIDGHQVQLNGSAQEINTQMTAKFPGFNPDALVAAKFASRDAAVNLFARNKSPPVLCWPVAGQDWSFCNAATIQDGINYLDNFDGLCGVPGTTCVRISCSYNAAIYLCNDNAYGITPNCAYMASYATDIINDCVFYDDQGNAYVCGQEFDTDGYNIIVREDSC